MKKDTQKHIRTGLTLTWDVLKFKQLDSIKAYELEDRRLQLAEKQLELNKQKLTGEFEIDPDGSTENDEITGVVDDV